MASTKKAKGNSVNVEIIMVEDVKMGGYSGHLVQFPNIIAEGRTQLELIKNLFNMINDIALYENREANYYNDGIENVIKKKVSLVPQLD